ncbi:hypothetical protein [Nonomuraea sp. B1E8]
MRIVLVLWSLIVQTDVWPGLKSLVSIRICQPWLCPLAGVGRR